MSMQPQVCLTQQLGQIADEATIDGKRGLKAPLTAAAS